MRKVVSLLAAGALTLASSSVAFAGSSEGALPAADPHQAQSESGGIAGMTASETAIVTAVVLTGVVLLIAEGGGSSNNTTN